MKLCIDKTCNRKGKLLPFSEFMRNRSTKDGRNPYCRECFLRRNNQYKERVRARKQAGPLPLLKVKSAIERGKRTREEIRNSTRLSFDDVGDALAELAFVKNELRVVRLGSKREFHLAA